MRIPPMLVSVANHPAQAILERARALAAERTTPVTTLHLTAALLDGDTPISRLLRTRGVRVQDLRAGSRVYPEADGALDGVVSRAQGLATRQAHELSPTHLLVAALTEPGTAIAQWFVRLGCDPAAVAAEVIHASSTFQTHALGNAAAMAPAVSRPGVQSAIVTPLVSTPPSSKLSPMDVRALSSRSPREAPAPPSVERVATNARPSPGRAQRNWAARAHDATAISQGLTAWPALLALAQQVDPKAVPVIGRDRELDRVRDALARREGRGALVVAPPGAGRTSLVRALGGDPRRAVVITLRHTEMAVLLRGPMADKLRGFCAEAVKAVAAGVPLVLALDPVAPWFTTRDVADDVVLEVRAMLARGAVPWVATATPEEARRLAEIEPWIDRTALRIDLDDMPPATLHAVVAAHLPSLAEHHGVNVPSSVAVRAVELSERYLGGRAQPDRTLAALDLCLARAHRAGVTTLDETAIATVVAELGGFSPERVAATDAQRLLALESHLATRVVGHTDALARVARVLRRNAVGFRGARPIGTFLLLGPTGVGKTETARAIAEALYPGVGAMARFDMGEYSEPHSVARLLGAPPGYVGHTDGGQLTEAVRRRPYQLVLLDEIEKAHRDVQESLLGLLDEGRMTDGRGRTVDFRHTVVVMTSNLGAEVYADAMARTGRAIGFGARTKTPDATGTTEAVIAAARAALPPELWNRIDEPVVYSPLSRDEVAEIARRQLAASFAKLAAEQGVTVTATPGVVELLLVSGGYEPALGARPMKRAIARMVEVPLAEAVLGGSIRRGDAVTVDVREGVVTVERASAH